LKRVSKVELVAASDVLMPVEIILERLEATDQREGK
jgi:hypothetical protein